MLIPAGCAELVHVASFISMLLECNVGNGTAIFTVLSIFYILDCIDSMQYWSTELAAMATRQAGQCNYQPLGNDSPGESTPTGENVGVSQSLNITSLILYWFSEGESYSYSTGTCDRFHTCEHYLQVIKYALCECVAAMISLYAVISQLYNSTIMHSAFTIIPHRIGIA